MGRKKKEFSKDGIFQIRFRSLCYESGKTQEQLAQILEVSRPTISGWLDGKNIPDILSLTHIAEHFHVSADYLLGLSETVSPDVSLRAAVEYTGLSEKAVEWLHTGFEWPNPYGFAMSEEEKRKKLNAASDLIQSAAFRDMLDRLIDFSDAANLEILAGQLIDQLVDYECEKKENSFRFSKKEVRESIILAIECAHQKGRIFRGEHFPEEIKKMNDEELAKCLEAARFDIGEEADLRHFLVTKAINDYLEIILRKCRRQVHQITEK